MPWNPSKNNDLLSQASLECKLNKCTKSGWSNLKFAIDFKTDKESSINRKDRFLDWQMSLRER